MDAQGYSPAVLDHFRRPRCAGSLPADGAGRRARGEAGSADDGRLVRFQVRADGASVTDVRFKAFGCPATIAAASWLAEQVRGRSLRDAARVAPAEVVRALALSPGHADAAALAVGALRSALSGL